jgi:hypothetical protein
LGGGCNVAGNCKAIPVDGRGGRLKREGLSGQGATDYDSGFWRQDDETAIMPLDEWYGISQRIGSRTFNARLPQLLAAHPIFTG